MASSCILLHPPAPPPQPLAETLRRELRQRLENRLGLIWTQPVQMLLEVPGYFPLAVSVSAMRSAAACTWFRDVRLESGKVVGGDLDAVSLVLAGQDAAADEQVVSAAQWFRSHQGDLLTIPPEWLQRTRDHEKPLLAHWSRTADTAADPLLWAAAESIAELLLESKMTA